MRKVEMLKWVYPQTGNPEHGKSKGHHGFGLLHGWSTHSDDGGHCPVAIIELDNGRVETHPAHMIRFLDKSEGEK